MRCMRNTFKTPFNSDLVTSALTSCLSAISLSSRLVFQFSDHLGYSITTPLSTANLNHLCPLPHSPLTIQLSPFPSACNNNYTMTTTMMPPSTTERQRPIHTQRRQVASTFSHHFPMTPPRNVHKHRQPCGNPSFWYVPTLSLSSLFSPICVHTTPAPLSLSLCHTQSQHGKDS